MFTSYCKQNNGNDASEVSIESRFYRRELIEEDPTYLLIIMEEEGIPASPKAWIHSTFGFWIQS